MLTKFRELADSLGLSSLVEAHDEHEVQMAIDCGARIIGVNNRNLKDLDVYKRQGHKTMLSLMMIIEE